MLLYSTGELMVIVEYCEFGSLESYLLKQNQNKSFIDQINRETDTIDPSIKTQRKTIFESGFIRTNDNRNKPYDEWPQESNQQPFETSGSIRPSDSDAQEAENSMNVESTQLLNGSQRKHPRVNYNIM